MSRNSRLLSKDEKKQLDHLIPRRSSGISGFINSLQRKVSIGFSGSDKKDSKESVRIDVNGRGKYYYDSLRDRLLNTVNGEFNIPHCFGITSCTSKEGVTTVALNTAITYARHNDGKILLVDMNYKNPMIHKLLNVKRFPGIHDYINRGADLFSVVQKTSEENLYILTTGKVKSTFTSIYEADEFYKLVEVAKNEFDYIIFDIMSMRDGDDAAKISRLLDGILIVVESEHIRWQVVKRSTNKLEQYKANIIGIVLNKRQFHIPRWIYDRL
ncbi:MAG: CpsD/CapB family tyrosine-protein kinase [bacterium]|nr:CpsD/CapB family tyrosine-protein kinase [bacterium]